MRFTNTKSEALNLRISPAFQQVFKETADHKQHSVVNMLPRDYCDYKGIVPHGPKAPLPAYKRVRAESRAQVGAAA